MWVGPDSAYSGVNCWGTNIDGNYEDVSSYSDLVSPVIDLGSVSGTPMLSFWHWYQIDGFSEHAYDGGNIRVSVDGGTSWQVVFPEGGYPFDEVDGLGGEPGYSYNPNPAWEKVQVDLSDYAGSMVLIGWRLGMDWSRDPLPGWYIDDVRIYEYSAATATPTVTPTIEGTFTATATATPGSRTSTPTQTATPSRTPTRTPPPGYAPEIMIMGYMSSRLGTAGGGDLTIIALVADLDGLEDIQWVQLYYQGVETGITLWDDGRHADFDPNDGVYGFYIRIGAGAPSGLYLIEIRASDTIGLISPLAPYLNVKE